MLSLSDDNQPEATEALNTASRYLDDLLNNAVQPSELPLSNANVSDTEASFLNQYFIISNGFVKTKVYNKRDD